MTLTNHQLKNASRFLVKILRHKARHYNLYIDSDGFIDCDKLLNIPSLNLVTLEDISKIVNSCEKKRFTLKKVGSKYFIAANQGHSIKIQSSLLNPITLDNFYKYEDKDIIHGSFFKAKNEILSKGLSRMNREHIHFTTNVDSTKVISGFRKSSEILIYINMKKAILDGFKFFESPNGVILCPGNKDGILPISYIIKVIDR